MFNLPENAYAMRPVRCDVVRNTFVYYEAVTFPGENPRGVIDMYLRRAAICGAIAENVESLYTIDILDEDDNVILELAAEMKAARYLIERLRLRVTHD